MVIPITMACTHNHRNLKQQLFYITAKYPLDESTFRQKTSAQETSRLNQLKVLIRRGYLKCKRDTVSLLYSEYNTAVVTFSWSFHFQTLTHLRIAVNICTGVMLGTLFIQAGNNGNRVLHNYNLLFAILMHHMMTTMMLTILTCELNCSTILWTLGIVSITKCNLM